MPDKLDSVFEHIGSLFNKLTALKNQSQYTPFEEIQDNKQSFIVPQKSSKEEILDFTDAKFNTDIQTQMMFDEYKREGSALSQILKEENALYDRHIETGIPMADLRTPEVEADFQRRKQQALKNLYDPKPMG